MTTFDSRSRRGFLTAHALKDGAREQYAVIRMVGKIVVELTWDPDGEPATGSGPWLVTITIGAHETARTRHETLNRARKRYQALVRAHP